MSGSKLKDLVEAHAFTKKVIPIMTAFARREFNLPKSFVIKVRIKTSPPRSWTKGQVVSIGGYHWDSRNFKAVPYMHLKLYPVFYSDIFDEYEEYEDDPEIGEIRHCDSKTAILGLIAHEISHAVQFGMVYLPGDDADAECVKRGLPKFERGHGKLFQAIYRRFRREFVNKGRREIGIPRKKYTPQLASKNEVIGRVLIISASHYGIHVRGEFDLIKEWTPTASEKRMAAEIRGYTPKMGYVTVRWPGSGKRGRIQVRLDCLRKIA